MIAVAFGLFIAASLYDAIAWPDGAPVHGDQLWQLIVFEPIVGGALIAFLRVRGWTAGRIGLHPSLRETVAGLSLALLCYVVYYAAAWIVMRFASPALFHSARVIGAVGLVPALLLSTINPVFEETFVNGYIVRLLKEHGAAGTGIAVSVVLRCLYHLYQGPAALTLTLPFGIIMAAWYARRGSLWPPIVAHAVFDFVALTPYLEK